MVRTVALDATRAALAAANAATRRGQKLVAEPPIDHYDTFEAPDGLARGNRPSQSRTTTARAPVVGISGRPSRGYRRTISTDATA